VYFDYLFVDAKGAPQKSQFSVILGIILRDSLGGILRVQSSSVLIRVDFVAFARGFFRGLFFAGFIFFSSVVILSIVPNRKPFQIDFISEF
jgi:hypothetical protein